MTEAEPDTAAVDQGIDGAKSDTPQTQTFTINGREGVPVSFRGRLLSTEDSRKDSHVHRTRDTDDQMIFAPRGYTCGACRWFEVSIYAVDPDVALDAPHNAVYVVHTVGRSIVPDEIDLARVAWADTPDKVIELLVQKRHGRPMLPDTSAFAIEDASEHDENLLRAYNHWTAAGVG